MTFVALQCLVVKIFLVVRTLLKPEIPTTLTAALEVLFANVALAAGRGAGAVAAGDALPLALRASAYLAELLEC